MAGPHDDPDARWQWFLDRRGKNQGGIPDGAYLTASLHKHRMLAERAAQFRPPGAPGTVNWTPLGPAAILHGQATFHPIVSGRITALAVGPGGQRIYAGAANGGVWFSADSGTTWAPLDQWAYTTGGRWSWLQADSLSVGAMAVFFGAAADGSQDTLYVGTGEPAGGYFGIGIKHSTDGGRTFTLEGTNLAPYSIYRILVDPDDQTIVLAATTNGLFKRPLAAPYDPWNSVFLDANNPKVTDVIVAGSGAGKSYYLACPGSGVGSSPSGASGTWTALQPPSNNTFTGVARIALAAGESDPEVVYALTDTGHLYRADSTTNQSLIEVSGVPAGLFASGKQGVYDIVLAVDPSDANTVYLAGDYTADVTDYALSFYKGTIVVGTGPTYTFPFNSNNDNNVRNDPTWIGRNIHPDAHALAFATNSDNKTHDGSIVWVGTDGGPFGSSSSGARGSFAARNTDLSITQLNYLAQREDTDAVVYAGCQDNGTIRYWGEPAWFESPEGDGGGLAVDPNNPLRVMRQYIYAGLFTTADGGLTDASWQWAAAPLNTYTSTEANRTGFYAPIRARAVDSTTTLAVFGTNRLWATEDWGQTWKTLPSNTTPAATNLTQDVLDDPGFLSSPVDPNQPTSYITAIYVESATRIYVGTQRGLWRFDRPSVGAAWTKTSITAPVSPFIGLKPVTSINGVHDGTLYVGFGMWNVAPLWYFDGTHWSQAIAANQINAPVNCLVVDPVRPQEVYVGMDTGVWKGVRSSSGNPPQYQWNWQILSNGLPEAAVQDLIIHNGARLLRAGTYGRGAWEIPLDVTTANDPDIYVRTDYADSGRINRGTGARYAWVDGVPDPTNPSSRATHQLSADIKVQRASAPDKNLPLDFPGYSELSNTANTMDSLGTNQVFVQVHNRSSVGLNPSLNVNVLLLLADASTSIPQLPAGYASHIASTDTSAAWLGNSGWKFADTAQPFRTATIASSRLSAVVEYDVDLSRLGLGTATKLCAALFSSAAGDVLASTELQLDTLTLAEKRVAYRLFDVFGGWKPAGIMGKFPLTGHTATLLQSGEVMVAGGSVRLPHGQTNTVEIYATVSNSWNFGTPMTAKRVGHTATLLPGDKVLVTGGWVDNPNNVLASAELYEPGVGWIPLPQPMQTPRCFHAATLLNNGNVLVAGGLSTNLLGLSSSQIFNSQGNNWLPELPMVEVGPWAQAVLLKNGRVLLVSLIDPTTASQIYDPSTNSWGTLRTLTAVITNGFTLTLLDNGKVLRAGGNTVLSGIQASVTAELFDPDPASLTWTPVAPMTMARANHAAVQIDSNVVLVAGGLTPISGVNNNVASAEVYDADSNTWNQVGPMRSAAAYHTLTLLRDGHALAVGGDPSRPHAELFVLGKQ